VKIGERGQVTIPKKLRVRFGLHKNVDVEFIDEGDSIRIVKAKTFAERLDQLRGTVKLKYANSVDEYIEEIRGR
jgi:AbrB family looped-hinge helix DNA binding protein